MSKAGVGQWEEGRAVAAKRRCVLHLLSRICFAYHLSCPGDALVTKKGISCSRSASRVRVPLSMLHPHQNVSLRLTLFTRLLERPSPHVSGTLSSEI